MFSLRKWIYEVCPRSLKSAGLGWYSQVFDFIEEKMGHWGESSWNILITLTWAAHPFESECAQYKPNSIMLCITYSLIWNNIHQSRSTTLSTISSIGKCHFLCTYRTYAFGTKNIKDHFDQKKIKKTQEDNL